MVSLKEKLALISVITLSLTWHLYVLINSKFTFYSDDAIYAILAQYFLSGDLLKAFHPTWPPLFPILSAIFYPLIGSWEQTLRLVSSLAGVAIIIPIYLFAKSNLTFFPAFAFILLTAFVTPILNVSLSPMSDMLSTLFILSSIVSLYFALNTDSLKILTLGAFFQGLIYLTRAEGTVFFALTLTFLLIYFFMGFLKKQFSFRQIAVAITLFILTFLVTVSPYVVAIKIQLGSWTISQKSSAQIKQEHAFKVRGGTTWSQEVISARSPNYGSSYFKGGTEYVLKNIIWLNEWFLKKIPSWQTLFLANFTTWSLIPFIIGIILFVKKITAGQLYLLFIFFSAIPITIYATPVALERYLLWTIPLTIYFIYYGELRIFQFIFSKFPLNFNHTFPVVLAFVTVAALPVWSPVSIILPWDYAKNFSKQYYREEIIQASNWINENSNHKPKILMRHEGIEFYTGGETIYLPQELSYPEILDYGKKFKSDFIVAWAGESFYEKSLEFLLNPKSDISGLKRVFQYPPDSPRILIYSFE